MHPQRVLMNIDLSRLFIKRNSLYYSVHHWIQRNRKLRNSKKIQKSEWRTWVVTTNIIIWIYHLSSLRKSLSSLHSPRSTINFQHDKILKWIWLQESKTKTFTKNFEYLEFLVGTNCLKIKPSMTKAASNRWVKYSRLVLQIFQTGNTSLDIYRYYECENGCHWLYDQDFLSKIFTIFRFSIKVWNTSRCKINTLVLLFYFHCQDLCSRHFYKPRSQII